MRIKIRIKDIDDYSDYRFSFLGLFISLLIVGIGFMGGGIITNLLSEQSKNVDYQELIHSPQYQHMSMDELIETFHHKTLALRVISITLFSLGVFVFLVIFGLFIWLQVKKEKPINNII